MNANAGPLQPARIDFGDAEAPRSLDYDDIYHPRAGAREQARHVFLGGNGLPGRWARRQRFVVLETGFGLGHNFLATWAAWRDDPARCDRLWFVSVEKHPAVLDDLRRAHVLSPWPALVRELLDAWPPATPDLHTIALAEGRVMLRLAFGDATAWMPRLMLQADAIYLDGFSPARNPAMWSEPVLHRLRHLAAQDATLATWSVAQVVRSALQRAGFELQHRPGFDRKREMLVGRFAPTYALRVPPGLRFGTAPGGVAVAVVGAGLAGSAVAEALHRHGTSVQVFEQATQPAAGASGNAAGLLHGVVHAEDTLHARWHRTAFLHAVASTAAALVDGSVHGRLTGLLRLETQLDTDAMRERITRLGLPAGYVQACDAREATQWAGVPIAGPAWCYPRGGWLDPRSIVQRRLARSGDGLRLGARVAALQRSERERWRLLDEAGRCLTEVDHVVLANAHDALRLHAAPLGDWRSTRGQVSLLPAASLGPPALLRPLAGAGYAIPLPDGDWLCGATRDADDHDAGLRQSDHQRNLEAVGRLIDRAMPEAQASLPGRVAWRLETHDRLPWVGALPQADAPRTLRDDQPRYVARVPGLHILAGLGSRGLAQSALGADIVAAWITGAPMPVGRDLLDAVDAARHVARRARFRSEAS